MTGNRYLEEAAQVLRRAAEDAAPYSRTRHQERMEIADGFARLAAVERGLLPVEWLPELLQHVSQQQGAAR